MVSKVLLTGGSGFIASHVLDVLLKRGYTVVATVRSQDKGARIRANHPNAGSKLDFAIVEDIAQPTAFDKAVIADPPFDTVIHTASPFHFSTEDPQRDLLDPAVSGTTGILRAIKKSAPSVKRVVITSSFAAIVDLINNPPNYHYSEKDWNGVTPKQAVENPHNGYRASKTFAERAAWEFVEKEKPNFTLTTCNPPMVFGPIHPGLQSLESLNTSSQMLYKIVNGSSKEALQPSATTLWIDVRDLAEAHVRCAERDEAQGQRFFLTEGYFSTEEMARAIKKYLPEFASVLPGEEGLKKGALPPPDKRPGFDNSRAKKVLGFESFTPMTKTAIDTVKSFEPMMKQTQVRS